MIQNAHVAGYDFVFEYSASRNIDTIAVIGNNDHSALWKMNIDISRLQSQGFPSQLTRSETPRPKVTSPLTVK